MVKSGSDEAEIAEFRSVMFSLDNVSVFVDRIPSTRQVNVYDSSRFARGSVEFAEMTEIGFCGRLKSPKNL